MGFVICQRVIVPFHSWIAFSPDSESFVYSLSSGLRLLLHYITKFFNSFHYCGSVSLFIFLNSLCGVSSLLGKREVCQLYSRIFTRSRQKFWTVLCQTTYQFHLGFTLNWASSFFFAALKFTCILDSVSESKVAFELQWEINNFTILQSNYEHRDKSEFVHLMV